MSLTPRPLKRMQGVPAIRPVTERLHYAILASTSIWACSLGTLVGDHFMNFLLRQAKRRSAHFPIEPARIAQSDCRLDLPTGFARRQGRPPSDCETGPLS